MNSALYRFLTLIALLSLVSTGMLYGQTAVTGAISGYVSDTSAAAVPDATVAATNTADNVTTSTVTNRDGLYRFPSLIPGSYKVTITKQGFAEFTREATRLDAGFNLRIDASLPVGSVTTKVDVSGEAPLVQTDSAEVNQTLQASEVKALPTFGRNITRLSLLAPGAFMAGGQLDLHPENAGEDFNLNVNGGQPNNNSHTLDGVDNTEKIQGLTLIVTSQDAVQEVKMTTSNYDAEYGKVSGGLFQITTKSGTNAFHGSLFEYYRTAGFFAADQFSQHISGVPGNRWNQFGGSIGGPIVKDKLFFFGDYQGMRNNLHTSGNNTVPIDAFRQGDFSSVAATDPIYDPATGNPDGTGRTQFDCDGILNKICPDRLSPAATNLLALLPEPTIPGELNSNYQVSRPAIFNQNQFNTRVDYFVTPKTVVFGKFSYFNAKFFTDNAYGPIAGGPPLGGAVNSGNSSDHDKSAMVDYQHTFSPSLLTDARFAFSRIIISELQLDSNLDTATTVGIPDINLGTVYTSGLPQFTISDPTSPFAMGDFGLPFFEREADFQFYNNWTKTVGRHAFKFGGDVEKFFGIRTDVSGRGAFQFAQSLTGLSQVCPPTGCTTNGSGLAAFELGLSSGFGRDITLVQPQEKQWRWAFYGQDNWRVNSRLTLMLGLRWDYSTPIFSQDGQSIGNLDLNTGNILLTNLAGKYAGVTTSKTEFSPRIGVSYRLMKDTVLRGGFGRSYFNNPDGAGFGTQGCCFPIKQTQSDAQTNPFASLLYTLDQGPGLPAPLPPFPSNGQLPQPNTTDIFPGVGPYPHSYNDSYNVTVEHALPHDITMSIAYVGNHGRHLWDNVDVNAPVPGPLVGGSFDPNRPYFAKFGWSNTMLQRNNQLAGYPELKSNYNSLQARVEKRFHAGLYLMSNFTWDKSLDMGAFGPQNIFDFASNYGNSDATRPWAWISAFNWELPFGRGRMYANGLSRGADAVIGGWALSGIVNLEAGQYFTPTLANNASLDSTIALRPDRIGSGRVSNPDRFEWFNPDDFTFVHALYTYGNSGRNILEGPGFDSLDASMTKTYALTERVHLEFKWDVFNALNHENLANPNASITPGVSKADRTAGKITSIVDFRRRMQLGLHLTF